MAGQIDSSGLVGLPLAKSTCASAISTFQALESAELSKFKRAPASIFFSRTRSSFSGDKVLLGERLDNLLPDGLVECLSHSRLPEQVCEVVPGEWLARPQPSAGRCNERQTILGFRPTSSQDLRLKGQDCIEIGQPHS